MNTTPRRGGWVRLAILLVIAALVAACGGSASSPLDTVGAPITSSEAGGPASQPSMAPQAPGDGQGLTDDGTPPADALRDDLKVVYTGSLELVVAELALTKAIAQGLATGLDAPFLVKHM